MFRNLTLRNKMLVVMLAAALSAMALMGYLGYESSRASLEKAAFNQLVSIRETKRHSIENYFKNIEHELQTLTNSYMVIEAMGDLKAAFATTSANIPPEELTVYKQKLGRYYESEMLPRLNKNLLKPAQMDAYWPKSDAAVAMQYHYLANNLYPTGEKDFMDAAPGNTEYDRTHKRYHEKFRQVIKKFGFYDLFLVDAESGDIVYTVFKEVDYGTNLLTGPYKNTNIAAAFRSARAATNAEFVKMVDFEEYAPSYSDPAGFIAAPIYEGFDKIGVLIVQVSIDELDNIMTNSHRWKQCGLGESGETYLVGGDFKMRSNSRFLLQDPNGFAKVLEQYHANPDVVARVDKIKKTILLVDVKTPAAESAVQGHTGLDVIPDYRGIPVLSAYAPVEVLGVKWYMLSEIDEEEAFRPVADLRREYLLFGGILTLLVVGATIVFSRTVTRPVLGVRDVMHELAEGALPPRMVVNTRDEVGQMNTAANELIDGLRGAIEFAQRIERGDLDAPFTPRGDKDVMGLALLHMRNGLKLSDTQLRQALEEALAQEEELRQNSEELYAMNEELHNKQRELQQKNELLRQNEEHLELKVEERTHELSIKNQEMTDSIVYASRLQTALMPPLRQLNATFSEAFILFKPQNIVSGDFYWSYRIEHYIYFAVIDCTGHGIPGSIISVIGLNALRHLVESSVEPFTPATALTHLDGAVETSLNKSTSDVKARDGMDVTFCRLDLLTLELQYATAMRTFCIFSGNEIIELRGDKRPIGSVHHDPTPFVNFTYQMKPGDKIYLFSDGYPDQFGGPDGKKFMVKRFRTLLWENRHLPMDDQRRILENTFNDWKGRLEQTDDVLVMGITAPTRG